MGPENRERWTDAALRSGIAAARRFILALRDDRREADIERNLGRMNQHLLQDIGMVQDQLDSQRATWFWHCRHM